MDFELQIENCIWENKSVELGILLLSNFINLNYIDEDGCTPLGFAAYLGRVDCVKILLSHGANPNFTDDRGNTALNNMKYVNPDADSSDLEECRRLLHDRSLY